MTEREPDVKKLAEWAGFTALCDREDGTKYVVMWEYPDGTFNLAPPDFPNDLNAIFKWLVPKLFKLGYWINTKHSHSMYDTKDSHSVEIGQHKYTGGSVFVNDEKLALALCKAIEKLIDEP